MSKGRRVRWLGNHSLKIGDRIVTPAGELGMIDAALALGTYRQMLARMVRAGTLKTVSYGGRVMVPMSEVLRLRRIWKATGRPTAQIAAAS